METMEGFDRVWIHACHLHRLIIAIKSGNKREHYTCELSSVLLTCPIEPMCPSCWSSRQNLPQSTQI